MAVDPKSPEFVELVKAVVGEVNAVRGVGYLSVQLHRGDRSLAVTVRLRGGAAAGTSELEYLIPLPVEVCQRLDSAELNPYDALELVVRPSRAKLHRVGFVPKRPGPSKG